MSFARPDLLWLAAALPALIAWGVVGYARRRRRVARLLGESTLVRRLVGQELGRFPRRRLGLLGIAAVSLGVAAAGPQWGTEIVETRSRSLEIAFALDVSRSMLARDVSPDRLERQRLLARRLLRELRGDRIGLVAFAGRAYVLSPLTVDHSALQLYLDALDPEIVSQGGSSLASAIRQATDLVRGEDPERRADYAVVLVSDGEALEEEDAVLRAAERAAAAGVVVHTVGLGTPGGAPIPELDPVSGRVTGYKRDLSGDVVISRRNDHLLGEIASITGGRFVRGDEPGATDRLLASLRGMERAAAAAGREARPKDRTGWLVALALLLVTLDALLAGGALQSVRKRRAKVAAAPAVAALLLAPGFGFGDLERGNRLYREGRYLEAVEAYSRALRDGESSPVLHYNLGTALLRLKRYDEAERHLRAALMTVEPEARERTHYNLGNRYLEAGREADDPRARAKLLDAAVEAYKHALRIDPTDVDAKWNLELALREQEQNPPEHGGGQSGDQGPPDEWNDDQGQGQGAPPMSMPQPSPGERRTSPPEPGTMTREQAERILSAAEQDERELFRQSLRKGRRDRPVARDW